MLDLKLGLMLGVRLRGNALSMKVLTKLQGCVCVRVCVRAREVDE